ncbi:hypothetical protein N9Z28_04885, partial [Akkermansiaceae bacterium]|nr:hypothetical protein [Akkermansiaceae bacterium]MDB4365282.1 hypothetical protein [Akkermansiaceae bacterium]MDB4686433.1 hypothetical protein [Akkermansiaceae bacterium]
NPFAGVRSKTNLWVKEDIVITSITYNAETGTCDITWNSDFGERYRIYYSTDLEQWVSLKKPIIGQGNTISERFSISGGLGFYRIQKE